MELDIRGRVQPLGLYRSFAASGEVGAELKDGKRGLPRINRNRVHARCQITQGCVNRAVASDARHWGQGLGADGDRNYLELEVA